MLGFTRHEVTPRSRQKSRINNIIIWTLITSTLVVLVAIFDSYFLHRPETKSFISPLQRNDIQNCAMTYLYPTFTEIDDPKPNSTFSQKYKLYLYREGYLDDNKLYGVPALFIPGQAGSHKQIRSLASTTTTLYHHQNQQQGRNIDFFTVDLNEELSALGGQTLLDQAAYMNAAIERILDLYNDPKPSSVMIIGHSMGGIVARSMFMLPNYIPNSINTIVTIATPHLTAPLLLNSVSYKMYKDITQYWHQYQNTLLKDVTLISIAGGSLDNIIHSDSVNMDSFLPVSHGFTTYTTAIPNVWTGADHMAILWCNQFIKLLASTLLEVVDSDQIKSVEERMKIFRYNLLDGGISSIIGNQHTPLSDNNISTIATKNVLPANESSARFIFSEKATESSATLIHASYKLQLLTNLQPQYDSRWSIVVCSGSHVVNISCKYTKPTVTLLPSATAENLIGSSSYRLLEVESKERNYDYIGIIDHGGSRIMDGDNQVFLIGHAISDQPVVHLNSVWDTACKGVHIHVNNFHSKHMFPFIRNSLFAYDIRVTSIEETAQSPLFKPMMQQAINDRELKYYRGLETDVSDLITFHQEMNDGHKGLSLQFFTDNQSMDISMTIDWYVTLGRTVLRYDSILITFLWMITLVTLLSQLYSYAANGKREFIRFEIALFNCLKGPILQLAVLLLLASAIQSYALNHLSWLKEYPALFNFASNYILFGNDDWMMAGLLLFAFALTVGLTFVIWLVVSIIVAVLSIPFRLFPSQQNSKNATVRQFVVHLTIATGLLAFLPSSVVFTAYFIVWLLMTASSRLSARSDLPSFQNIHNYRLSWLIFLISLLPYNIPSVIAYVKDIIIGFTYHSISPLTLLQDIPALLTLIYLVTLGKNPDVLEIKLLRPLIYIINGMIVYQALFGFLHPFLLSHFI